MYKFKKTGLFQSILLFECSSRISLNTLESTMPTKPVTKRDIFSCLKGRATFWNDFALELQIEDGFCSNLKSSQCTPLLEFNKVISMDRGEKMCIMGKDQRS